MKKVFILFWIVVLLLPNLIFSQIYVSTMGNDAKNGLSWATAKLTINAGISAAATGQTVFIDNGTYAGCTLNKSVNLQGQGIGATIIQGGGSGNGINVTTNISRVTISDLSVINL